MHQIYKHSLTPALKTKKDSDKHSSLVNVVAQICTLRTILTALTLDQIFNKKSINSVQINLMVISPYMYVQGKKVQYEKKNKLKINALA